MTLIPVSRIFLFRALFCEAWCFAVDGLAFFSCNWASFVDRLTGDVEEAAEGRSPTGTG